MENSTVGSAAGADILLPTPARTARHARIWAGIGALAIAAAGLSIPLLQPVLRPGLIGPSAATAEVRNPSVLITQDIITIKASPYATVEDFTGVAGLTLLGAWLDPVPAGDNDDLPAHTAVDLSAITDDAASIPPTGLPARVHTGTYALTMAWQIDGCDAATLAASAPESNTPRLVLRTVAGSRIEATSDTAFSFFTVSDAGTQPVWCTLSPAAP